MPAFEVLLALAAASYWAEILWAVVKRPQLVVFARVLPEGSATRLGCPVAVHTAHRRSSLPEQSETLSTSEYSSF